MSRAVVDFTEKDPLTRVYLKLWELLEATEAFTRLVPRGNRIKFHGPDRSPGKDNRLSADYPEVRIEPAGGQILLFDTGGAASAGGTKGGTTIRKAFQIEVATGDRRIIRRLLPLEWAIAKAIGSTQESNLDLAFVTDLRIETHSDFPEDPEDQTADRGWMAVVGILVTLDIDNELELQA